MKITKEQAAANRRRIVDASARAFQARGVDAVGVNDVMKSAGFTHGGFYNHFESKDALVAEAFAAAFAPAVASVEGAASSADRFARALDGYLTVAHRDDPANGCPTAALVGDAGRQGPAARGAYAAGIGRFLAAFESRMPGGGEAARRAAIETLAGMVGAMVMARGIGDADEALSMEILETARVATAAHLGKRAAPRGAKAARARARRGRPGA